MMMTEQESGRETTSSRERAFVQSRQFRERCLRNSLTAAGPERERDRERERDKEACEEEEEDVFAFGNTTVVDWGRIVPREGFFSPSQLFPLGFAAVRYEVDAELDSIVELLCEIDAVITVSDEDDDSHNNDDKDMPSSSFSTSSSAEHTKTLLYSQAKDRAALLSALTEEDKPTRHTHTHTHTQIVNAEPLFRVTARWYLVQEQRHVVRVYEGRNAPQVWQAVMMESVGVDEQRSSKKKKKKRLSLAAAKRKKTKRERDEDRDLSDDEEHEEEEDDEEEEEEEEQQLQQHSDVLHKKRARKRKRVRQIESKEDEEGEDEQGEEEYHEEGEESHEEKDGEQEEDSLSTAAVLVARTAEEEAEEELSLRRQIFEQRRAFFRLMRQAQREGVKKPIRPRLALENMENFFDATLLKCIEGLENASRCTDYIPLAERSSPRLPPDFIQRDYTAMENRIKALLKLSRKLDLFEAQCKLHAQKQLKIEEQEMRKRNEFQAKEIRALVQNAQKVRAQRTKELEKATSMLKTAKLKAAKKKREEVKALVDGFVDRQIVLHARRLSSSSEFLSSAVLSAPRPVPRERAMCGVDEHFLSALQLWQYISCCGSHSNSSIHNNSRRSASAFACEDVFAALRAVHPLRERLLRHAESETGDCVLRETQRENTLSSRFHAERSFSLAVLNALGSEMLCNCKRLTDGLFGIETADRSYTSTPSLAQTHTTSSSSSSTAVVSLPVSALHWKELARNLLLLEILRSELDLSTETELSPWLRGKTSAGCDHLDKKLIKLARLRVDHCHRYAREVQESIAPLRAGMGVSLSVPVSVSRSGRVCDHALAVRESLRDLRRVFDVLSEERSGSESVWAVSDVLRSAVRRFRSLSPSLSPQTHTQLQAIERGEYTLQETLSVLRPLCMCDENDPCVKASESVTVSNAVGETERVCESESEREKTNTASPRAFLDRCALLVQALLAHPTTSSLFPASAWIDLQDLSSRCSESETESVEMDVDVVMGAGETHEDSHTTTESPKGSASPISTRPARLSLLEFYRSVQRIFASVAVKHLESVSMSNYAFNKLYCVFERLFLETVLCCDAPLYDPLACVCCRNGVSFSETPSTHVVCERCEGVFHAACVEPPITLPVRGDWFCPYCVEQRGVSSTHPLCTARVTHPHKTISTAQTHTPLVGEVVGIEPSPSRGELFFVVEFNHGLFRERWSSQRVCEQLHSEQHPDFLSPAALGLDLSDYDAACAVAKGYAGWGLGEVEIAQALTEHTHAHTTTSHPRTPLHTPFDTPANQALSAKHEALRLLTEMSRGDLCVCDAHEWMSVLRSLVYFYQHTESIPDASFTTTTQTAQTTSVTTSSAVTESSSDVRAHPPHSSQPTPQTSPVRVNVSDGSSFRAGSPSFLSPTQEEMSMGDDQSQNTHTHSQSQPHNDTLTQPQTTFDGSRELAQLASLRGEEDAIAAFETLCEMTARYESEPLEEPPAVRNALGDFWLCCEKAMRGALSKPPESVSHTDAWCDAFVRKMLALSTQALAQAEAQSEKVTITAEPESQIVSLLSATPVCVVCRLGERDLCHPFVDVPCETLSLCEDPLHTPHNAPTQPAGPHKIHHCCLTLLTQCRELAQERAEKEEALSASETLRFVSTPHNVWVGRDRHGGLYWLLQDSQTVLVCESPTPLALSSHHSHSSAPSTPRYTYYREKSEILRLIQWLEIAHPSERRLKRVLSLWTESSLFHSVHAQRALREAVCVSERESVCGSSSELCGVSVSSVRDLLLDDALQRRASNRPFSAGDEVLILSSAEVKTKCWRARVVDVHTHRETAENTTKDAFSRAFWYAVEVMDVPLTDVRYVSDCDVCLAESELATAVLARVESVCERNSVLNDSAGKLLTTLNASRFVNERQRMGVHYLPRCSLSLTTHHTEALTEVYTPHSFEPSDISLLKDALLLVVSALPLGAIDENSEDKWARNFKNSWRATVSLASDAFMLMNCQLMLEYSIKPAWLKPSGLKAFSQLPSRGHALRNATIGSVAIRLWMLDQCVRYEKVLEVKPVAESGSKSSKSKKK